MADYTNYLSKEMLKFHEEQKAKKEARQKLIDIADLLKLPTVYDKENNPAVPVKDLLDIFFNADKLKKLISRINLKAFW